MHFRTIVFMLSIGLNLVLGIGWAMHYFNNTVYSKNPILRNAAAGAAKPETRTVSRKPAAAPAAKRFHWQNIESRDYATYIQNLRSIGCPEETIRNIIVAEVNSHFAQERKQPTRKTENAWWKSETQETENETDTREAAALENEKNALLTELPGPDWQQSSNPNEDLKKASGVALEGPVLGDLPPKTKETVYNIAASARRRIEAHADSQRFLGRPVDPVHVAQLRQEMRSELARVLDAAQYEEFLLRYSETANQMRRELRGIEVTPEEFRNLFRLRDPLANELAMLGDARNGANAGRIRILESQIEGLVQQTLGPQRYAEYRMNQDPMFREAQRQADQLGLPPETTMSLVAIRQQYADEQERIQSDNSLTPPQRIDALAEVAAEQQKALLQLLGTDGFARLQQVQNSR